MTKAEHKEEFETLLLKINNANELAEANLDKINWQLGHNEDLATNILKVDVKVDKIEKKMNSDFNQLDN